MWSKSSWSTSTLVRHSVNSCHCSTAVHLLLLLLQRELIQPVVVVRNIHVARELFLIVKNHVDPKIFSTLLHRFLPATQPQWRGTPIRCPGDSVILVTPLRCANYSFHICHYSHKKQSHCVVNCFIRISLNCFPVFLLI